VSALRRRSRLEGGDRGLSLAEMLVTMMVLSLFMIMVTSMFSSVTRTFTRDRSASDSTRIASIAMNEVTRVLRSGTEIQVANAVNDPVFLLATDESVVLRAYLDTDSATPRPIVARFEVTAARNLVEKRWNANPSSGPYWKFTSLPTAPFPVAASSWTNPAYERMIAQKITPAASGAPALFQYYDAAGLRIVPPPAGKLTDDQLKTIAAVRVTMSVQADLTDRARPVVVRNTVGIPNLGISRVGP